MRLHYIFTFILISSFLGSNSCCYAGKDKKEVQSNSGSLKKFVKKRSDTLRKLPFLGFKEKNQSFDEKRSSLPLQSQKKDSLNDLLRRRSMPDHLNKPTKFSRECKERLQSYKGKTPDEVLEMQLKSSDWYTRNSARCYRAYNLRQSALEEAKEYIKMAHKEGFPAASFELVKMALNKEKVEKAKELLELTCVYAIDCQSKYDDQNHSTLVKSIKAYVRKNPQLKPAFKQFKSSPLFQDKEKKEIELNQGLIIQYGEDKDPMIGLDIKEGKTLTLLRNQKEDSDSDLDPFADFSDDSSEQ